MKKLATASALLFSAVFTAAQEQRLTLITERQHDNSVTISYRKTDPGTYTVVVKFDELTNTKQPATIHSAGGYGGTLLTLKPENTGRGIGYKYNYRYILGKLRPKVDRQFCYIIPYASGTNCRVTESGFVNEMYFGAEKPADWKSYFFYTDKEEVVTAVRKGVIVDITDQYEQEQAAFTTRKNAVYIEHEDGSLARYLGFRKGTLRVKKGDIVLPGTALGRNAPAANNSFGISLYIYYLVSADFESLKEQTLATPKSLYATISPRFITAENTCSIPESKASYIAFLNEAIITKEMSKKELKKYKEK